MRSSSQRLWYIVAGGLVVAIIATVAVIAPRASELWNGKPYSPADPDAVAERVQDRSRDLFLEMRLRDPITPGFNTLRSTRCKRTSLINSGRTDRRAIGVRHNWGVRNIDERAARGAMDTLADRLFGDGWKAGYAYDNNGPDWLEVGSRFEDPVTGDIVAVQWGSSRQMLVIDVESPCARIPGDHPKAAGGRFDWTPKTPFAAPGVS
ncbi:hypothetical protein [Streptomyces albipurpureus]|uniref:Secreted protein n=1 Tax=Streptomyces albipurpureus TaxID=2897419 RepID=A0ABT0UXP6_9ACTN|nr:hypothetical protein [Streptomyces sp. CWNU-1]MCM2393343.1 hypothetical protein [Streptomyces sp. CWNU-1]